MSDQYYRRFMGDYIRDTGDLSLIEHGAYTVLLDNYYSMESLPAERERLYRICRAISDEERAAVDVVVERYFYKNGNNQLVNKRADKEIKERKAFVEAQSARGKAGAAARWSGQEKPTGMAQAMQTPMLKQKHKNGLPSPSPSIIPPISPKGGCDIDERFEVFWLNYPRKVGKGAALKAWKRVKNKSEVFIKIKENLPKQKESEQWLKDNGRFIPNPATYLNQARWEDEIP